jgi:hypothetical protein
MCVVFEQRRYGGVELNLVLGIGERERGREGEREREVFKKGKRCINK